MNFTPDIFLIFILLGGFLIIITSAAVYAFGWPWCKKLVEPKELEADENYEPSKMGRRASMNVESILPPKGPGFYTSPTWTSNPTALPAVTAMDNTMMAYDQPIPPAEWMGTYAVLGLSHPLGTDELGLEVDPYFESSLYNGGLYGTQMSHVWNEPPFAPVAFSCDEAGECCDLMEDDVPAMDFADDGGAMFGIF